MGAVRCFSIEGTGSKHGLSRTSCASEDIPSSKSIGPISSCGIQQGKSDAVDAESAARAGAYGQADGQPKSGTGAVEIRHLKIARDTAVKAGTRAGRAAPELVIVASPGCLREQSMEIKSKMTLLRRLVALRPGPLTSTLASAKGELARNRRRWLLLDAEIKQHDAHLETLTATRAPRN